MIFASTVIENFFSISASMTWEMEDQGLVLICGENHDSQTADSNGSGKSTLFEALVWALWGKTTRGQVGDAVINRKAKKNCRVAVWLKHDKNLYCVTRYRKHDKEGNNLTFELYEGGLVHDLSQGTATMTQEKIDVFLGVDYDTFIQGPMIPQGNLKHFSEMTDGEQKAIFDRALQVGVLSEALKETIERINAVKMQLGVADIALQQTEKEIEDAKHRLDEYETERKTWNKTKQISLGKVIKEIAAVIEKQELLWQEAQSSNSSDAVEEAKSNLAKLRQTRDNLQRDWAKTQSEINDELSEVKASWKEINAQVRSLQTEINNIQTLSGTTCPTCGQEVSEEHIATCQDGIKVDLEKKNKEAANLSSHIHAIETELSKEEKEHKKIYDDVLAKISDQETALINIVEESSAATKWLDELDALRREESTLRRLYATKQLEQAPFDTMVEGARVALDYRQRLLAKRKAECKKNQIELAHLEFWKYGFSNKGIKSCILESVTPFLNDRAARYIKSMTGGELQVEFNTQTTLKSGETREKFSVIVTNSNGADTYAGNSGGEKRRADLAINFVMSDLMSSRARRPYPQRFLDEPFENLDESGIEAAMELLSDMAASAGSIFVITHLDSMKGRFSKTIKLVKKNGITVLVEA